MEALWPDCLLLPLCGKIITKRKTNYKFNKYLLYRSMGFYTICVRASQRLHDNMFKGLISTSMRFFDTNPSGRILNRFSKDMGATDEFLPKAVLDATQIIFNMCGAVIVTSIVNPLFIAPVAILMILFFFVRRVYLKTSKNLKRLDGTSESIKQKC